MPWQPRREDQLQEQRARRARRARAARLRRWARVAALAAGGAGVLYLGLTDPLWWWTPGAGAAPGHSTAYRCWYNTYDCRDFRTRAEAQAAYRACGGRRNDVHGLDADGDGRACEPLP